MLGLGTGRAVNPSGFTRLFKLAAGFADGRGCFACGCGSLNWAGLLLLLLKTVGLKAGGGLEVGGGTGGWRLWVLARPCSGVGRSACALSGPRSSVAFTRFAGAAGTAAACRLLSSLFLHSSSSLKSSISSVGPRVRVRVRGLGLGLGLG